MTFDITTFSDWVRRRRRTYYTGAVPQLEQQVYYEDLGNSLEAKKATISLHRTHALLKGGEKTKHNLIFLTCCGQNR
jgi:hypothetical protein